MGKHWALGLALAAAAAAAQPARAASGADAISLDGHVEFLRDASGALRLDDVRSPAFASAFRAAESADFGFGFTNDVYWYRVVLQPRPSWSGWVLEIGFPTLDSVDVHLVHGDGHVDSFATGDLRQAPPEQLPHRRFAFPIAAAPGERLTAYVRVFTVGAHLVSFAAWSPERFHRRTLVDTLVHGGFFGILLAMVLYNLLIWLRVRDPAYGYYVLFLACTLGTWLDLSGYARLFGNPLAASAPALIHSSFPLLMALSNVTILVFSRTFLQMQPSMPRGDLLTRAIIGVALLVAVAALVAPYRVVSQAAMLLAIGSIVVLTPLIVRLGLQGSRPARLYLVAFGVYLAIVLASMGQIYNWVPGKFLVHFGQPLGISLTVVLMSLALADRITQERRERERLARLKNFFAPQVAEAILEEGGASLLAPKRREVTVVFADLRGFTAFAAQSEPEDVIRVLREYHEAVVETTAKHGGNVEHIAGDGVMIYFNAPVEVGEPEARAMRMSFELRERCEALSQSWRRRGHALGVGIGMACGYATVGAVGAKGRMDYSCIGTVTNLAARLCAEARHGQILVTEPFVNRVEGQVVATALGEHELKGLPKPVELYDLHPPA